MNTIIDIEAVSKTYGRTEAVDDLSLSVRRGECLALIGHNGAGKTTLFKLILGLIRASSGEISVRGVDPAHPSNRCAVAYLPEVVTFPGSLTGKELLKFYADLKNRPVSECRDLLELVGLADAANKKLAMYSKGMRQRLGLAQVLLGSPEVILLDEPTSGLDPSVKKQFYSIIEDCKKNGATIVISSHALSEIETKVNRIAILSKGRLVQIGTLDELRQKANLPVQFRVSTRPEQITSVMQALQGRISCQKVNGHGFEFSCSAGEKISILNEFSRFEADIVDIEMVPPNLDDLYMHFAGSESDA